MSPAIRGIDLRSAWLIAIACAAVSMVVAAMAALNTALPDIAVDIGADSSQMTWIIDGYTLALAALLLPAGSVGDRFGRRGILFAGLVVFAVASLLAIWVDGPTQLIGTRVLAGAAAALIMPATLSLITSGLPESKRAVGVSIWAAVAGVGAIAGFLVTGVLLEFFSWRAIFVTFAASAALTAVLVTTIGSSRHETPGRFDVLGSATSILAVTGVVFGLLEAPQRGWDDALVLVCLVGGVALIAAFCVIEIRSPAPLLDVRLFTNRAFGSGALAVAMQFFASFAAFYLILQQLQLVFGYSPLGSALALMPMVAGVAVFSFVGNWLAVRFHSLKFVLGGGIFIAGIGVILLGALDYDEYWVAASALAVAAVGLGLATAPSTTAIMSNIPMRDQGVGSAVNDTARELGAAIGIALAGSIVAAGYTSRITPTADLARAELARAGQARSAAGDPAGGQMLLAQADPAAERISRSLAEATAVADRLRDQAGPLAQRIADGAQAAFIAPMNQAYIIVGVILLVSAVVLGWLAPRRMVADGGDAAAPSSTDADAGVTDDGTEPAVPDAR